MNDRGVIEYAHVIITVIYLLKILIRYKWYFKILVIFSGVLPHEILFSHVICQFVVMCGQTALVLIFMILVFGVECKGDIFLVICLTILQGLCGMCFGKTCIYRIMYSIIFIINCKLTFIKNNNMRRFCCTTDWQTQTCANSNNESSTKVMNIVCIFKEVIYNFIIFN